MTFDLSSDWLVLPWLAPALVAFWWARRRAAPALARSRSWALWIFRGCVLAAFITVALNPVRLNVTPGALQRPEVHILLDASQSMTLGSPESRWQEGTALLRAALERQQGHARNIRSTSTRLPSTPSTTNKMHAAVIRSIASSPKAMSNLGKSDEAMAKLAQSDQAMMKILGPEMFQIWKAHQSKPAE